jgi:hypothetical protein
VLATGGLELCEQLPHLAEGKYLIIVYYAASHTTPHTTLHIIR